MWAFLRAQSLSGRDYDVLWACMGHLEGGNLIRYSAMALAHLYGIPYGSFLRGWNKLIALGVLVPMHDDLGSLKGYRFSPRLTYCGRPWKRGIAEQQFDAQRVLDALEDETLAWQAAQTAMKE